MKWAVELNNIRADMDGEGRKAEFSLAIKPGEFVALVGPNRSGKGLLLKLCAGLIIPEEGTIRVLEEDLTLIHDEKLAEFHQRIGVVLQQPALRSNMTVYANIALPIVYHTGVDYDELRPRILPVLEAFGLEAVQNRFPAQITQGEARCTALARALITEPDLLLLDELMAGLDAEMVQRVERALIGYRERHAVTILATMRNPSPLLARADRIVFLRDGRIEAVGPYAEMAATSDPAMRVYFGSGTGL